MSSPPTSQHKYGVAAAAGKFDEEIVPVMVKVKKEMVEFKVDEQPRPDSTAEKLANLKPAFKRDGGTVTAGNASGINDGAAALVIMSAEKAKELGVKPLAKIVTGASAGVDPSIMGIGPVYATRKALKKANLELKDIDLIEANEAFAAQSVAVANELGFDMDKVNVNGGAVALGHPIGASGCRILVDPALRDEAPQCQLRPCHAVRRRRHGRCHHSGRHVIQKSHTA